MADSNAPTNGGTGGDAHDEQERRGRETREEEERRLEAERQKDEEERRRAESSNTVAHTAPAAPFPNPEGIDLSLSPSSHDLHVLPV